MRAVCLIACSVALLVAGGATASVSTFGGRNGKLVYQASGHLYLAGPTGGRGRQLPVSGYEGTWSRDGRRLAFVGASISVARADGTRVRRLMPANRRMLDLSLSWLPDGRRIVFHREDDDATFVDLFTVPAAGGRPVPITRTPHVWEQDPAVSPDGRTIVFSLADERSRQTPIADGLFLVGIDGKHLRRVTTSPEFHFDELPSWSPDGRRIAFTRDRSHGGATYEEIYVVGADGTGLRRITQNGYHTAPIWSPDGRWIAFCEYQGEGKPMLEYLVRPTGGTPRLLPLDPPGCVDDWQAVPSR